MGNDQSSIYANNYGSSDHDRDQRIKDRQVQNYSAEDRAQMLQWVTATSWKDILLLNRAFLRRETEATPFYCGPIYWETVPMVPALERLHDYGIFTTASQPWREEGPESSKCGCCHDYAFFHTLKRAFLTFILPQADENIPAQARSALIKELLADDRVYTSVFDGKKGFNNFPSDPIDYNTHTLNAPALLKKEEWACTDDVHVYQHSDVRPKDEQFVPMTMKTSSIFSAKLLHVNVLARAWSELDVLDLVAKKAVTAGMKPVFAV